MITPEPSRFGGFLLQSFNKRAAKKSEGGNFPGLEGKQEEDAGAEDVLQAGQDVF